MSGTIQTILNFRENMSAGLRRIAGHTEDNQREVQLLNNRIQDFRENATSNFANVAKSAAGLAIGFIGIAAAGETIVTSIDSIKEYSAAMSQLQASTNASASEMASLKSEMVSLYGQNFGESWADVGESLATVAQITGQTGQALEDSTANALIYRDVFKAEIPDAMKTVNDIVLQFGGTSEEAFNLMAQGASTGLDKTGEMMDGISEFGVHFKQLGYSSSEMFDAFGAGLESGAFSLSVIGDSVKEFGIRAKDGSDGTAQAFKDLNLDAATLSATFAAGGPEAKKAFDTVVKALDNVKDPLKQNTIGTALFGSTWEDLGAKSITALANVDAAFDSTTNTMDKLNAVKYTDVESAIGGIKRQLEASILVPIADKILPKLGEFSTWMNTKMPEIKEKIAEAFDAGKKVMDKFADGIAWVKDNANWLTPVIVGLTAAIVAQKVINTIVGMYNAWKTATTGMTVAQWAMNIAMNASPFGWVALAIGLVVGAGILLWKNWDTIKEKATELWGWLGGVWTNLKEGTVNTFNGVSDKVKGVFASMVGFVKTPINAIIGMINGLIDKINSISIDIPDWIPGDMGGKTFGINIPKVPELAMGTTFATGGLTRVNERGGEIMNLPSGTQVIPADKSEMMVKNHSNTAPINIIIQGNVYGVDDLVDTIGRAFQKIVSVQLANQ